MTKHKAIIAGLLAGLFLASSVSTASAARWHYYHRGPGPVLGLVGAAVVGAATIATAPFALLADAARPAPPPPGYYGAPPPAPGYYDAPPPPPPGYYRRGYYSGPGYYGPPPGYYGGY